MNMKKMMLMAMMMVMTIAANAVQPSVDNNQRNIRMSYTQAREEAAFLSDKMAHELNLTAAQYDAVYEINLDYIMSVGSSRDVFGTRWDCRNSDLRYVLSAYQYDKYMRQSYFYRPMAWTSGSWHFAVRNRYTDRTHFYNPRPATTVTRHSTHTVSAPRVTADEHFGNHSIARHSSNNGHRTTGTFGGRR